MLQGDLVHEEYGLVCHHGLRERGELHPLSAKIVDLPNDLLDRSFTAIEDGAQLDDRCFNDSHGSLLAGEYGSPGKNMKVLLHVEVCCCCILRQDHLGRAAFSDC